MSTTIELHEVITDDSEPCGMPFLYEYSEPYADNRIGLLMFYEVTDAPQVRIKISRDNRSFIEGAIASVFTTANEYLSMATTNAVGECSLYVPADGYIVITKDGYQTQRHNYTAIPQGLYMDLTMLATAEIVGNKNGYSVSLSPNNPQGTDYF